MAVHSRWLVQRRKKDLLYVTVLTMPGYLRSSSDDQSVRVGTHCGMRSIMYSGDIPWRLLKASSAIFLCDPVTNWQAMQILKNWAICCEFIGPCYKPHSRVLGSLYLHNFMHRKSIQQNIT